jgi:hypothetical protein
MALYSRRLFIHWRIYACLSLLHSYVTNSRSFPQRLKVTNVVFPTIAHQLNQLKHSDKLIVE